MAHSRRDSDVSDLYKFSPASNSHSKMKSGHSNPFLTPVTHAPQPEKYDPAGTLVDEERQWRVKATLEKQRKHANIVGVSEAGIRLYDDMGQLLLRHYPLSEIQGFKTDVSSRTFSFAWKPTPAHPSECVVLHSSDYCLPIHNEVNDVIARVLTKRNVENPDIIIEQSGLKEVGEWGSTMDRVKKRLSRGPDAQHHRRKSSASMYPVEGYIAPPSAPMRRDSNAPPVRVHRDSRSPKTSGHSSRASSRASSPAVSSKASPQVSTAQLVDLEDF